MPGTHHIDTVSTATLLRICRANGVTITPFARTSGPAFTWSRNGGKSRMFRSEHEAAACAVRTCNLLTARHPQ